MTERTEIVGTWKFLNYIRTDPGTGKNVNIFGEHPRGWLIYTAEGRMMVMVVPESRRQLEKDEDRIEHHKHMVAYTGRYAIVGDKVIHYVDVAWNEAWIGTNLVRSYSRSARRGSPAQFGQRCRTVLHGLPLTVSAQHDDPISQAVGHRRWARPDWWLILPAIF
jgi:hypothetical protein